MTEDKLINFSIDKELAEKFHLALELNKENSKDVITRLMVQYVSESFLKASKSLATDQSKENSEFVQANRGSGEKRSSSNTKITKEMVEIAYSYAKKVYFGKLTRTEGKLEISRVTGMNVGSAQDYITDFLAMMEGKEYHRTMSNYGTVYYLKNIKKDFGDKAFQLALEATEKHIKYYNALGNGRLKAKEEIVRRLKEKI